MVEYHITFRCQRCSMTKIIVYLRKPKTVRKIKCIVCDTGRMKPIFPIREITVRKEQ